MTQNASQRLIDATWNGCAGRTIAASSYNSADAIQFVYDEGRNPQVANGPVAGLLNGALPIYANHFAAEYIKFFPASNFSSCLAANKSALLVSPVYFTGTSLTPTEICPEGNNALTVGNILVAVFGSLVFVNAVYAGKL